MVSGLWTEGGKASGQINKAVLTSKLSINTENGGPREKGILVDRRAEEHEEALSYILAAMELLQELGTHTRGVFGLNVMGKVDGLRKCFYAWLQTASHD